MGGWLKLENKNFLAEGSKRDSGKDAQRINIYIAKLVGESVRTTLGPKGMDKMLVNEAGDVTVTNDGVTILRELEVEHPVAKMIVQIAETQESEVGDGTTTAVVLAGELLRKAEYLLDKNIHPAVISKGYREAAKHAAEIAKKYALNAKEEDFVKIGMTAMTGKGSEDHKEKLAKTVNEAINITGSERQNINIEKKSGESTSQTELIKGLAIDKEKVHPSMPSSKKGNVALLDIPLEIRDPGSDAKISISDPEKIQSLFEMEENMIRKHIEALEKAEVDIVFCQKGIDDLAQYLLAKKGIYACRRIKKSDMEKLSKATGAKIISDYSDIQQSLGKAKVKAQKIGSDEITLVTECENPELVTIIVKGETTHVADEAKRAVEDAIGDLISVKKDQKIVGGAGSFEIKLAKDLRKKAEEYAGKEQLVIQNFADSLEIIPRTLAENAGKDSLEILSSVNSSSLEWPGVDVFQGEVVDAFEKGIIEPLKIKTQALSSATQVANMILRIDDVILNKNSSTQK